jgi:hypothetical protein
MTPSLYPRLIRNQWFDHHDYTLRVADQIDIRLTEEQVWSLRDQIEEDRVLNS